MKRLGKLLISKGRVALLAGGTAAGAAIAGCYRWVIQDTLPVVSARKAVPMHGMRAGPLAGKKKHQIRAECRRQGSR
jgi:hypothetical protein